MATLSNQQLVELGVKNKTQFNFRLPSGQIIPAGINPAEAATMNVDVKPGQDINSFTTAEKGGSVPQEIAQLAFQQLQSGITPLPNAVIGRNEPAGQVLANQAAAMQAQFGGGVTNQTPAGFVPPSTPSGVGGSASPVAGAAPLGSTERTNQLLAGASQQTGIPAQTFGAPATQPGTPTVGSVPEFIADNRIVNLEKKINDLSTSIRAGVFTGREAMLGDLFKQFGVEEAQSSLNQFNQIILREQNRLEDLPDAIRTTLQDVGVSQAQLDRLVVRDSEKILKQLNEAMRNAGAQQDRINQSLQFVGLFFDAKVADEAAKVEAMKFDLEMDMGQLKDLKDDQRDLVKRALDEQKSFLLRKQDAIDRAIANGATPNVISQLQASQDDSSVNKILSASG